MVKHHLKSLISRFLICFWLKTLRVKGGNLQDLEPGILGIWHEDLVATTKAFSHCGVYAMISKSQDGEIFSLVAKSFGYQVVRGSSSGGQESIRHLLRSLKQGKFVAMALDGPKGPVRKEKPGSKWLSKKSEKPLYYVHVKYGKHICLSSWDKAKIPLPFSKVQVELKEQSH